MLNCRWQAIEPRGVTAWEATHSAQRSLVSGEIAFIKRAPLRMASGSDPYCTRRVNCVPVSRCRFPVLELNKEIGPDVLRDSPLIPTTPRLVDPSGYTIELLGPPALMEGGAGMLSE